MSLLDPHYRFTFRSHSRSLSFTTIALRMLFLSLLLMSLTLAQETEAPTSTPTPQLSTPTDVPTLPFVCQICPAGVSMMNGTRQIPFPSAPTCAELNLEIAQATKDECTNVTAAFQFIALPSFCGCEGIPPPDVCAICDGGGTVIHPERSTRVDFLDANFTCSQAYALAQFVTSSSFCGRFQQIVEKQCCSYPNTTTAVPTPSAPSPTVNAPPTALGPTSSGGVMPKGLWSVTAGAMAMFL